MNIDWKIFFSLGRYQKPVYTDIDNVSKYARHDVQNNTHVFTVLRGNRFYLKLNLRANPWPRNEGLSKNGVALQRSPQGNILLEVDSMDIQTAQFPDAGNYTISCSNSRGEARFSFRLDVMGKTTIVYFLGFKWWCFFFPLQLQMHTASHALLTSEIKTTDLNTNRNLY